eukprot:6206347-Pleurochrysis_carterae.AAC.1
MMYARQAVGLLIRPRPDCRFSARGNLHRVLDLAAGRPAVLARAQPSGYQIALAASRCPCIAGCEVIARSEISALPEFSKCLNNSYCHYRLYLRFTYITCPYRQLIPSHWP